MSEEEKDKAKEETTEPKKMTLREEWEAEALHRLELEFTPWNRAMMYERTVRPNLYH